MAKDKMNIPQIRFKGFEGEWEKQPFSKIYSHVRNGFVGTATPHYVEHGIPYIQGRNIKCGKLLDNGYVNISEEFHKSKPNSKVLVNDLLIVQSGHVGDTAVVCSKFEGANCHAILVATPANQLECNSYFYNSYFLSDSGKVKIQIITTGNTVKHILSSDLKTLIVPKPIYHEQTQIGDFFQKIDQVIELQQKALDTARAYKQSMLQKMFPQKGEKVPRVRFAGFSGDWEQRRLSNIVKINPSAQLPMTFKYVDLESVKGHILMNVRKESRETAPSRAQRVAIKNDIFYQTVRPYQRNNYLFDLEDTDYVFSTGYAQLRPKKVIISLFLFSVIQTVEFLKRVLIRCTGTSYPAINSTDLGEITISFPSLEEQTAIGNFFQKLDQQIEQQAQKLATYQQLKKAMLQRMFV